MGAWGVGLFSDDLACDVRADYRELLEDGVSDEEATQRVLDCHLSASPDPDEDPVVWLALAVTQSKVGRLDPVVRDRALAIIDTGKGLELWADDARSLAKRRAVLDKARADLVGPLPARKALRRPRRHATGLCAGEVLAYRGSNNQVALLRVARVEDSRHAVAPVLVALDYDGDELPPAHALNRLKDRVEPFRRFAGLPWSDASFYVQVHRRVDFDAAGFWRLGTVDPRPDDDAVFARSYLGWEALARVVEGELTQA